jgi:NAD(P)-dependent dehydrogenase (short-subunit alcohol dehydrogenase family)
MATNHKTVAFLGASTGVGLAALKHTIAAGHQCIALCRVPSKLTSIFPPETTLNLQIVHGNAHDIAAVSKCLVTERGKLVDEIIFTVGGAFSFSKMSIDDLDVCRKAIATVLEVLTQLRSGGATGKPHIVVFSSTGISRFGRDTPLAMVPLYYLLKVPHKDKEAMETCLVESEESYTIIHASMLVNGETNKKIRVGIEDLKTGRESQAIGYTISWEDAGKWITDNLVLQLDRKYVNKIVMVTY